MLTLCFLFIVDSSSTAGGIVTSSEDPVFMKRKGTRPVVRLNMNENTQVQVYMPNVNR